MFDLFTGHFHPLVLALLPDGESRLGKIGVIECPEWNRDEPVKLALDLVIDVGAAFWAEMKADAIAAVGDAGPSLRFSFYFHALIRPARLHCKRAARPLLAGQTMTDRDANRLADSRCAQLLAAARGSMCSCHRLTSMLADP